MNNRKITIRNDGGIELRPIALKFLNKYEAKYISKECAFNMDGEIYNYKRWLIYIHHTRYSIKIRIIKDE